MVEEPNRVPVGSIVLDPPADRPESPFTPPSKRLRVPHVMMKLQTDMNRWRSFDRQSASPPAPRRPLRWEG
ncbi:hypothetical protein EVAR_36115_1 [Eumeta japonica]|uniref:Uncharacterized protein n=1 Tax=Eumeta variegata TaxID=151549 RepID=A0A4C1X2T0_EUMVA|nr:hypothetical protein EVAR_36115_1 [Eumeta japonica]